MNSYPLYPDDRLRGRPRGRTKKVMNVSMALDVYNALMKIPEGERSGFIANSLRPLAKQFDPGPSSDLVLTLKCLLDSAIEESKKSNDYEKLAAVSSLANEIMPVLNPYLDLCREDGPESKPNYQPMQHNLKASEFEVQDKRSIRDIIEGIRTTRILGRLQVILQNAETIHNAVLQQYRGRQFEKDLEETRTLLLAVSSMLGKNRDYAEDEKSYEKEYFTPLASLNASTDFRRDLTMHETVKGCKKILEDSRDITDADTLDFVSKACSFVDASVRRSWGSGIRLFEISHSVDPERGMFLVTLYNDGHYDVSISDVRCDGRPVTFHARAGSGPHHLPVAEESTVEVRPCLSLVEKKTHKVTFEIDYVEFTFEISGQISQHDK